MRVYSRLTLMIRKVAEGKMLHFKHIVRRKQYRPAFLAARFFLCLPVKRFTVAKLFLSGQPDVIVRVNPQRVQLAVKRLPHVNLGSRFLVSSSVDWENIVAAIRDVSPHTAMTMRQLLVEGKRAHETLQYSQMMEPYREWDAAGRKGSFSGKWRSAADVDAYFEILCTACREIQENGYKTQRELSRLRPTFIREGLHDEIPVSIGSSGELYLRKGGTHRILIAQHYGIKEVPVRIISIDETWAAQHLQPRRGKLADVLQSALK